MGSCVAVNSQIGRGGHQASCPTCWQSHGVSCTHLDNTMHSMISQNKTSRFKLGSSSIGWLISSSAIANAAEDHTWMLGLQLTPGQQCTVHA